MSSLCKAPARFRSAAFWGLLAVTALTAAPAGEPAPSGWPGWRGPYFNGSAVECERPLTGAKLLWTSEESFPPMAGTRYKFTEKDEHYYFGGYADPVVADGKVYVHYFRPSGVLATNSRFLKDIPAKMKYAHDPKRYYESCAMTDADDILVCLDADTGKTLWRREWQETGVNHNAINGQAYNHHGVPCIGDGKVFVLGSGLQVFAVDAGTGEPAWQSHVGPAAEAIVAWKTKQREALVANGARKLYCKSAAYGGGVLAVSDFAGVAETNPGARELVRAGGRCGVVGIDGETGERLWTVPNCNAKYSSPLFWHHGGKAYVIASNRYNLKCIEARTGEVLWTVPGSKNYIIHNGGMTMAIAGDLLVLQDLADVEGVEESRYGGYKGGKGKVGLTCYRLSLEGAEKVWRHDFPKQGPAGADDKTGTCPIIYRDHVYFYPIRQRTVCLKLATGEQVAELDRAVGMYGNAVAAGGFIFAAGAVYKTPALERASGKGSDFGKIKMNRYCGPAIVDGRMYVRDNNNVHCYTLTGD